MNVTIPRLPPLKTASIMRFQWPRTPRGSRPTRRSWTSPWMCRSTAGVPKDTPLGPSSESTQTASIGIRSNPAGLLASPIGRRSVIS